MRGCASRRSRVIAPISATARCAQLAQRESCVDERPEYAERLVEVEHKPGRAWIVAS
jgi:hypothetical protein